MPQAEKDAIKFIEDLDWACAQTGNLPYIIHLLNADDKKEQVKKQLLEAYGAVEGACQEIEYNAGFGSKMIDDIKWYIYNTERCIYNDIDDKVHDMKKQIAERGLLRAPKFGTWQSVGIINEDWDQIV